MNGKDRAFTLMELMVVVTIVGIMAGFAIPNYTKSVERSHRKDAENNLLMIQAAQQLYRARNDAYFCCGDITAINSNLGLNIIENGMTYALSQPGAPGTYLVIATRSGGTAFFVTITQVLANPVCTGACP